jgi:hypothetical protein
VICSSMRDSDQMGCSNLGGLKLHQQIIGSGREKTCNSLQTAADECTNQQPQRICDEGTRHLIVAAFVSSGGNTSSRSMKQAVIFQLIETGTKEVDLPGTLREG